MQRARAARRRHRAADRQEMEKLAEEIRTEHERNRIARELRPSPRRRRASTCPSRRPT
jgi:hypothetical protein